MAIIKTRHFVSVLIVCAGAVFVSLVPPAGAQAFQGAGLAAPGGYGLKVYKVESGLYPFVQVYFRTFDQMMQPLVNLNMMNIGIMVKGRSYDPLKRQYTIDPLRQRPELTRTVIVLDASGSLAGGRGGSSPFEAALRAAMRYITVKRPQDEVAVLSIRDTKEGYEVTSQFERDDRLLAERLADVRPDGQKTRLYDTIGAAMQMCGLTAQGSSGTPGSGDYPVSCSIVVLSDGHDEGGAISREELNTRITNLEIPIPVYSLAYSRESAEHFKNLEAISKNSFGLYFGVGEAYDEMQRTIEAVQNVILSDYVVTYRSYIPVDGETHTMKLGVEYPTGSGKYMYQDAKFEAIALPPIGPIPGMLQQLNVRIPPLPDENPYFTDPVPAPAAGLP
ncbi:MAG: VWA domain-containing protein [Methylococcaceae bacterium]|nr:VWA domain-containing protein [Methylococcaceae bacterium]